MSLSVTQIQTIVRHESRDSQLDLTTTQNLAILNLLYRRVASLFKWPEFVKIDSSLTTVKGQSSYTWPTTYSFIEIYSITIDDHNNGNAKILVAPTNTDVLFSSESNKVSSFPTVYRRTHNGTTNTIEFAPSADYTGSSIRIRGLVEPSTLVAGDSTAFLNVLADDALALLMSSDLLSKKNQPDQSTYVSNRAIEILSSLTGRKITPSEIIG